MKKILLLIGVIIVINLLLKKLLKIDLDFTREGCYTR